MSISNKYWWLLKILGALAYIAAALLELASLILLNVTGPVWAIVLIILAVRLLRLKDQNSPEAKFHLAAVILVAVFHTYMFFNFRM